MTDEPRTPDEAGSDSDEPGLILDTVQARVLGCLVEKAATTPDSYPLTLNSVVLACNQKSNRDPMMKLEPGRVGQALRELEKKGLVRREDSARAVRYAHTASRGMGITPPQLAVLALLLLRGPQTLNELYVRSERLTDFDDAGDVEYALERLAGHAPSMAVRLPRGPGQREDRYMHLLCGPVDEDVLRQQAAAAPPRTAMDDSARGDRLEDLEARVSALEQAIERMTSS